MWRKQTEGKPPSSAPGTYESPASVRPASSAQGTAYSSQPVTSSPSASNVSSDVTVLTRGLRIKGELSGKGEITIDGELIGSVHLTEARVAIGPNGHVKADIDAREVIVRGTVEGNLRGRDRVVLGSSGNVRGDIDAARVAIEDGAIFKGRVEIGRENTSRAERESPRKPAANAPAPAPAATAPKPSPAAPAAAPAKPASAPPAPVPNPVSASTKESNSTPQPVEVPGSSH
jgi:cytoskeletal protein CcmA (bactofilin family)